MTPGETDKAALPSLIGRLFEQAQTLAKAEIRVARASALERLRRSRLGLALLLAAFVILQAGFIALLIGLVGALAKVLGPAWAGLILFAICAVVAGALAFGGAKLVRVALTPSEEPSS